MFERPKIGEKAILVHIDMDSKADSDELAEFQELSISAGAMPVGFVTGTRRSPDSRLFVGSGKAEEIGDLIQAEEAELVIFNHSLSPSQERNLEREFKCRVVDRTGLILDIFAQRARSFEGKLQVELAQLRHLSTRLVRGWTHLERQKGGIGLRGPGETQLETDRRLLNHRIAQIRRRLEKVASQRNQGRKARSKAEIPTVSLVGYTNAGKSTLFNSLTDAEVYAKDQLFATLDPTLRRLDLPGEGACILADTVGFISHLPHELVAAFKSTLQETTEASLLLHVIDTASPQRAVCIAEVNDVLKQIGADKIPQIEVYNKIDLTEDEAARIERGEDGLVKRIWLSAQTGEGLDLLREALAEFYHQEHVHKLLQLQPADGRLRARLFELGGVISEKTTETGGWDIEIDLPKVAYERLLQQETALESRLVIV
ncbi:ribosome rescue GTPase HflX [Sedimenticola selenatireducens]|uniref:GTPase HflX n=1 Tax=Sedimenticola selenatireducens TaxID=191960 RepID=A0A557SEX6_9GAMM|nr:ribosome rescue GTPase HflX [Sedimenticola selenatireducens]TVO75968.1 GTPase HflX [Sedimenticola selenatireducens]TVT63827.1 MAG: GTPase HflX [Sedimenticola selenatireducens]